MTAKWLWLASLFHRNEQGHGQFCQCGGRTGGGGRGEWVGSEGREILSDLHSAWRSGWDKLESSAGSPPPPPSFTPPFHLLGRGGGRGGEGGGGGEGEIICRWWWLLIYAFIYLITCSFILTYLFIYFFASWWRRQFYLFIYIYLFVCLFLGDDGKSRIYLFLHLFVCLFVCRCPFVHSLIFINSFVIIAAFGGLVWYCSDLRWRRHDNVHTSPLSSLTAPPPLPTPLSLYHLVGLFVKASASRAADPGFDSRLLRTFFPGRVIHSDINWHSSGYPARRLAF